MNYPARSMKTSFFIRAWLIGLVAFVVAGCTTVDLSPVKIIRPPVQTVPPIQVVVPVHTPVVTDTWSGIYSAVLPCPDCPGLKVTLSLYRDATYDLRTEAIGAGNVQTRSGAFTFNADETRITLDANGQNRMFDILPPASLRMLDRNGQRIAGPDAERFILRK